MKTLVNKNIWFVAILAMVCGSFVSCTTDDDIFGDGFSYNEKNDTSTTPTDNTSVKDSIDWNMDMEKTFGYSNGQWPSTITVHYTGGKDTTFRANLPMTTRIEAPAEVIVDKDAPATRFSSLDSSVSIDSTEWAKNNVDGYYYRTITRRQVIHMNNYDATIISTHAEAYMVKEGKVVYFKHGQEATPSRWNDQPKAAGEDVQKGDTTYTVENAFICMQHKLHASKTEYPEATTKVLREKKEEKSDEPVVTPTMPTPELKIRTIKNIPDYTFSPEFSGNQLIGWHKVLPVLATAEDGKDYYFIWVDGKYVAKVAVGKENRVFNSAYFAEGSWRPATLEKDTDGGWKYVFVVNNEGKLKTVAENLALTSGLQNFRKSDNASQTPSVYTEKNYTEYSGRKYVEVIGFDIDMNPLIKTTIGECL